MAGGWPFVEEASAFAVTRRRLRPASELIALLVGQ
jgi:hypothetical protein